MKRLEVLISHGRVWSAVIGKSSINQPSYFAGLIDSAGNTLATGDGATSEGALNNAIDKFEGVTNTTSQQGNVGMTRMPGV